MEYTAIIVAIIFFSSLLFYLVPKKNLPWNWPFVKMMPTMYLKSHQIYDKITQLLVENNNSIMLKTSWITDTDILVTSDQSNVQHILNSEFSIYQRGTAFRDVFDFFGDSVFNRDVDVWKEEKKFIYAFFKENQYKKTIPKIIHHTLEKGLIPILDHMSRNDQVFDLQTLFNRFMLDATVIMATGFDLGSLQVRFPENPLLTAMDDMSEAAFYRHILPQGVWKLQRWLGIGREKKLAEASKTFYEILANYMAMKRKLTSKVANDKGGEKVNFDVLKFYLEEAGVNGSTKRMDVHLASNLMTLLFAGRDTSGALLTWFFWLISRNPQVESKILQEVKKNISENASQKHVFSNLEELSKLVYLHSALCEALRLYPAGPVILRVPNQEDILPSGHKVGPTTKIMICSYAMGRDTAIWGDDCLEFKPERWLSDKGVKRHVSSNIFLAFSSGPWTCPGKDLAFTRMTAVAATMIYNFHIHVLEGQEIVPSISAILSMKNGLKATVSSRWV